jgi:hypothetical protein
MELERIAARAGLAGVEVSDFLRSSAAEWDGRGRLVGFGVTLRDAASLHEARANPLHVVRAGHTGDPVAHRGAGAGRVDLVRRRRRNPGRGRTRRRSRGGACPARSSRSSRATSGWTSCGCARAMSRHFFASWEGAEPWRRGARGRDRRSRRGRLRAARRLMRRSAAVVTSRRPFPPSRRPRAGCRCIGRCRASGTCARRTVPRSRGPSPIPSCRPGR